MPQVLGPGAGSRLVAAGLVGVFIVLGAVYSLATPAWEAPDEPAHFAYATHLLRERGLPVQRLGVADQSAHPPLYYLLVALAALPADLDDARGGFRDNPLRPRIPNTALHSTSETFPFQGHALALHLGRLVSVALGAATVALTIRLGWRLFPERAQVGLLAGALVAFTPQFLFISGSLNNDNLVAAASAAAFGSVLGAAKQPTRLGPWVRAGAWWSIAILGKVSALVLVVPASVAVALSARRARSAGVLALGAFGWTLPALPLAGWWFARNWVLYGDPLGWKAFSAVYADQIQRAQFRWDELAVTTFRTFWGFFGWVTAPAPDWLYLAALALTLAGGAGLVRLLAVRRSALDSLQQASLAWLGVAVVAQLAFLMVGVTRMGSIWHQGRFLFPVISPLMVLLAAGLLALVPRRWEQRLAALVAALMAAVAAWVPFGVIGPAYSIAALPKTAFWTLPNPVHVQFGETMALRGYDVGPRDGGRAIEVTLYWEAVRRPELDYSVFVHVVDDSGHLLTQKDHPPGLDRRYPPTLWLPGDLIADGHVIDWPAEGRLRVRVGVYDWRTGQRLPVAAGEAGQDFNELAAEFR